jgi:hypothetical protein
LGRDESIAKIPELRQKAGHRLSLFVLNKYASNAELEALGHAELTTIVQKLIDIGNGTDRLRRAAAAVGDARYSTICRELNFASESIDEIQDRDALQRLLARVEAETAGNNGGAASVVGDPASQMPGGGYFRPRGR